MNDKTKSQLAGILKIYMSAPEVEAMLKALDIVYATAVADAVAQIPEPTP